MRTNEPIKIESDSFDYLPTQTVELFDNERKTFISRTTVDIFASRCRGDKITLPKNAMADYLGDDELMGTLAYYGLDKNKFWFYSVWALDFVMNLKSQTLKSACDEFAEIIDAIEQTNLDESKTDDKAELTLRITKGGEKSQTIKTDNRFTISAIYYGMKMLDEHLSNSEPFSVGSDAWWSVFNCCNGGASGNLELKETYMVYFFSEKMKQLLMPLKKAKGQKKSGSTSRDFLISKMVYIFRLSRNKDYWESSTFLRSTTKNVDVGKYDPINNVYPM